MSQSQKHHSLEIDVMKALLAVGMILDHAIILLADKPARTLTTEFKNVIGLVSFSGFLFCFGYATWHAYFSKAPAFKRILPSALRPWIAYYISAYFYLLFIERSYGNADLLNVLLLARLVPYAEFLPAFSLTLLLGFLLRKPIGYLLERPRLFFAIVGALLFSTFIPANRVQSPLLSLFIGSPEEVAAGFPLLQYFPLYLIGIYFARYNLKPNPWIGLAGIAGFYLFENFVGGVTRFPPNLAFILGSAFFVLAWYALSRFIGRWTPAARLLAPIGINALFYLVMSNVLIFAFRSALPKLGGAMSLKATLEVSLAMLAVIYFLTQIVRTIDVKKISSTETSESA